MARPRQAKAMLERKIQPKPYHILLVVSILILLGSVGTSKASAYYSLIMEFQTTVSSPEVILQNGTAGTSTIYTNNTSAKGSLATYPWWNSDYDYRKRITITNNNSTVSLPAKHTINFTVNTQQMVTDGKLQADGDDFRIVWWNSSSSSWLELDRLNTTNFNTTSTAIRFRTQASIAGGSSDNDYYIYYGYSGGTNPPANGSNVYFFEDLFNRANSSTVGFGWIEYDGIGASDARILNNQLNLRSDNTDWDTQAYHMLDGLTNRSVWEFEWDFNRTIEVTWSMWMQLGKYSLMSNTSNTAGASVYLDWTGTGAVRGGGASAHETLRVWNGSSVTEIGILSGSHLIKLDMDLTAGSFTIYIDGNNNGTYDVYQTLSSCDCIRFVFERATVANFASYDFNSTRVYLVIDPYPSVTLGSERNPTDYVDNNTSDIGSPTDIGTHSNFAAQQYGPDSVFDILTEENTVDEDGAVVSVERVDFALSGTTTSTSNLTKGQNYTQSVPFATHQRDSVTSNANSDDYTANCVDVEIWDDSGTAAVRVTRTSGLDGSFLTVYVVEFSSDITVQQGSVSAITGTGTNVTISSVNQSKAFALFYYQRSGGDVDAHVSAAVRSYFASNTVLRLNRASTADGTFSGHWYVVEDTASHWTVQQGSVSLSSTQTSNTDSITSVNTSKTFLIASMETTQADDDVISGTCRVDLQNSTSVRALRNEASDTITASYFAVEFYSGGPQNVYRGLLDFSTSDTQLTASHNTVNASFSIAWSPMRQHASSAGGPPGTGSSDNSASQVKVIINGGSNGIIADRDNWGANPTNFAWEVIEWEACSNYELDLEVQWTNTDFDETYEELAIYAYIPNNTYSLDATGGYMIVGNGTVDWGSTEGTISFWVKMDGSVQGRFWGQDGNMETRWSGTNLLLDWGGTGSMTSAYSFSADTWYFVAIVWDEIDDDLLLYVGDENNPPSLDANSLSGGWTSTTPSPTENRFLYGLGGPEPVDGHGDELRYWNVARNLTQLQSDYNTELIGSESNLRSYFKLNGNFDDIGPDSNYGSGYDGYSFSSDVPFQLTENIQVDVWNGSTWQNIFNNLTDGWNNKTVSAYLTSSNFTIRFRGSNETSDTSQDSWNIDATLLYTCTFNETTHDYVLRVNNTVTDSWEIRLRKYSDSNVDRLQNCTIYFHNSSDGTSNQIIIENGSFNQTEGPWYNLGSLETVYIAVTVEASSTGTSNVYTYLEIRTPGTTTYLQYKITFEIT